MRTYHAERASDRARSGGWYKYIGHWAYGQQHGPGMLLVRSAPSGVDAYPSGSSGRSGGSSRVSSMANTILAQLRVAAKVNAGGALPAASSSSSTPTSGSERARVVDSEGGDKDESTARDNDTEVTGFWLGEWCRGHMTGVYRYYSLPSSTSATAAIARLPEEVRTFLAGGPLAPTASDLAAIAAANAGGVGLRMGALGMAAATSSSTSSSPAAMPGWVSSGELLPSLPPAASPAGFIVAARAYLRSGEVHTASGSSVTDGRPVATAHFRFDRDAMTRRAPASEVNDAATALRDRAALMEAAIVSLNPGSAPPAPVATPVAASPSVKVVTVEVEGSFRASADCPFVLCPSQAGSGMAVSSDLCSVSHSGGGTSIVLGSKGFSRGVHYWEVVVERAQFGHVYIGVAERSYNTTTHLPVLPPRCALIHWQCTTCAGCAGGGAGASSATGATAAPQLTTWRDYGFINYMAVHASHIGAERLYGKFYNAGDRVGVCLNMDEGTISFTKEGEEFGETKGESPGEHLTSVLTAATLLQQWDRVPAAAAATPLPTGVLAEAHGRYRGMYAVEAGTGVLEYMTRAGVRIPFARSRAACTAALTAMGVELGSPLRGGDRIQTPRGVAMVVGAYRDRLWYTVEGFAEQGAWYWSGADLSEPLEMGMFSVLDRSAAVALEDAAESGEGGDVNASAAVDLHAFTEWVSDPVWTADADGALVALVNAQCDRGSCDPEHLLLTHAVRSVDGNGYPAWAYSDSGLIPLPKLRARFAVLLCLNARLGKLLPLADLTLKRARGALTTDAAALRYPSALGRRVAHLRGLAFTRTKVRFWSSVLRATAEHTQQNQDPYERPEGFPEVKLSTIRAKPELLLRMPSRGERVRASVFGQLLEASKSWNDSAFRRAYSHSNDAGQQRCFFVKFVGEGVDDQGGPYRAAVQKAAADEPSGALRMLVPCPNEEKSVGGNRDKVVFNPFLHEDDSIAVEGASPPAAAPSSSDGRPPSSRVLMEYRYLGVLQGMAVRNGILLPVNLPSMIWRALTGLHVREEDLAEIDVTTAGALDAVMSVEPDPTSPADAPPSAAAGEADGGWDRPHGVATLRAVAARAVEVLGKHAPRHAASAAGMLTFDTRAAFVQHLRSAAVRRGYTNLFLETFMSGLAAVLPMELLPMFTPAEAETLFCGRSVVDLDLLRRVTEYDFVNATDPHIQWFWEVLEEFSPDQRAQFVSFVSARSRLPSSADAFLSPMRIEAPSGAAREHPDRYLPKSATCFFKLTLPKYSSKAVLREKLLYGLQHAVTMDADVVMRTAEGYDVLREH